VGAGRHAAWNETWQPSIKRVTPCQSGEFLAKKALPLAKPGEIAERCPQIAIEYGVGLEDFS